MLVATEGVLDNEDKDDDEVEDDNRHGSGVTEDSS